MKTLKVRITLHEEALGTASANPEIHREFIASKATDVDRENEEVSALDVEHEIEKSMTVFPRSNGAPIYWDYQIKGFFKDACAALARVPGTKSNKLKAYKKIIDGTIFVSPRRIGIQIPEGGKIQLCQRPLRGQTAQGERIALATSETVPSGSTIECEILLLDEGSESLVREWLDYGRLRGLGQWRNSGKGRFTWEEI